jgi:hypothetical protein
MPRKPNPELQTLWRDRVNRQEVKGRALRRDGFRTLALLRSPAQ